MVFLTLFHNSIFEYFCPYRKLLPMAYACKHQGQLSVSREMIEKGFQMLPVLLAEKKAGYVSQQALVY